MNNTKDISSTKLVAQDIYSRWGKISEEDAVKVKSREDLSEMVAKAYRLDKGKADAAVTAWMPGRNF
jgi:hypothetical protein